MKLSLAQFYSCVTDSKLKAGFEYYYDERLIPDKITPEHFSGSICGNYDDYGYSVDFDEDGDITKAFCDCPSYSSTHFCKHLVAVMKLREEYIAGNDLIYDDCDEPIYKPFVGKEEVSFSSMPVLDPQSETFDRDFLSNNQDLLSRIKYSSNQEQFIKDTIEYLAKINRIDLLQEVLWSDSDKNPKFTLQTLVDTQTNLTESFFSTLVPKKKSLQMKDVSDFLTSHEGIFYLLNEDWIVYYLSKSSVSSYQFDLLLTSIIIHKYKKSFEYLLKNYTKDISFLDEIRIVKFVKENYKPEEYYSLFLANIDNHTFTNMEFDLVYPYLSETELKHILSERIFQDSYGRSFYNISLNFVYYYTTPAEFLPDSCSLYEMYVLRDRFFKNPKTYKAALRTFKKLAKKHITSAKVYLNEAIQIAEIIKANITDENIYAFATDPRIMDGFKRVFDLPTFVYADSVLTSRKLNEFIGIKEFKQTKGEN